MLSRSMIGLGLGMVLTACATEGDPSGAGGGGDDPSTSSLATGGGGATALPDSGSIHLFQRGWDGDVSAGFWRGPPVVEPSLDGCEVVQAGNCSSIRCPDAPAQETPAFIDAGAVSLDVGGVSLGLEQHASGWYSAYTEGRILTTDGPTILTATGADVPAFAIDIPVPPASSC